MSKYVIKNCPAIYKFFNYYCRQDNKNLYYDCTDCMMKRIVELCKRTCRMRCTNDCLGTKKHCGYGQILKLLDIQEVE